VSSLRRLAIAHRLASRTAAVLALLLAGLPAPAASGDEEEPRPERFRAEIDVVLTTVEVRALTPRGDAIPDLGAADFRAWLDGEPVPVAAADWIPAGQAPTAGIPESELAAAGIALPRGERYVLVFVQSDMVPSRLAGHLRMLPHVSRFLAQELTAEDWVAVVSFDSRLRLRQDFTRDPELLAAALRDAIRYGGEPAVPRFEPPSLGVRIDEEDARTAASPERAVELAAAALAELDGEKAMVYLGWGLGRFGASGVRLGDSYHRARDALARARIPVFVLDVSTADYHSLEVGLQQVAGDSGGTYARTHLFPGQAMRRLAGTMAGHYLLSLERPARLPARGRLRVELVGREGTVVVGPG
jgi:VWFA-related protein